MVMGRNIMIIIIIVIMTNTDRFYNGLNTVLNS